MPITYYETIRETMIFEKNVYLLSLGCKQNKMKAITLFENGDEWQKTKPVPIPLPKASRNFYNVKTRNK